MFGGGGSQESQMDTTQMSPENRAELQKRQQMLDQALKGLGTNWNNIPGVNPQQKNAFLGHWLQMNPPRPGTAGNLPPRK